MKGAEINRCVEDEVAPSHVAAPSLNFTFLVLLPEVKMFFFQCCFYSTPKSMAMHVCVGEPEAIYKAHGPVKLNLSRGQRWLHHYLTLLCYRTYQKHVAPLSPHTANWLSLGFQCFSFVRGCVFARTQASFYYVGFFLSLSLGFDFICHSFGSFQWVSSGFGQTGSRAGQDCNSLPELLERVCLILLYSIISYGKI